MPELKALIVDCVGVCLTDGEAEALPTLEKIIRGANREHDEPINAGGISAALRDNVLRNYLKLDLFGTADYWMEILEILHLNPMDVLNHIKTLASDAKEDELGGRLKSLSNEYWTKQKERCLSPEKLGYFRAAVGEIAFIFEGLILDRYRRIEPVISVLKDLRRAGYNLGMVSNTSNDRGNYWQTKFPDEFGMFGCVRFSCDGEVPIAKPDGWQRLLTEVAYALSPRDAYGLLITEQRITIDNLAVVDDKVRNVEAAMAMGVKAGIVMNPPPDYNPNHGQNIKTATPQNYGQILRDCGFRF